MEQQMNRRLLIPSIPEHDLRDSGSLKRETGSRDHALSYNSPSVLNTVDSVTRPLPIKHISLVFTSDASTSTSTSTSIIALISP